jgi:hypothetical protein
LPAPNAPLLAQLICTLPNDAEYNASNHPRQQVEDHRCQSLFDRTAIRTEAARCKGVAMEMEDPRCRHLLMNWCLRHKNGRTKPAQQAGQHGENRNPMN